MLGTFAGALDARKINAKEGRLTADVRGEVENEDKVLIIRRVHVTFHLRAENPDEVRETVDRVHGVYADSCPVYRSLKPAFAITSSVELVQAETQQAASLR
jgi:uncharacterized OsmC-like protein